VLATGVKYLEYSQLNCLSSKYKDRIARINWGIQLCTHGTYCTKPKRDHTGQAHSDQMVLGMINQAGEAGPCYQGPRVSKLTKEEYEARVHSDQMVPMKARQEAGPREQRPTEGLHSEDTQMRVGKQLAVGSQGIYRENRPRNSLGKGPLTLFP
jgi:hypothetical protein